MRLVLLGVLLVVLVSVLFLVHRSAQRMPDLSRMEQGSGGLVPCPGGFLVRVFYNEPGSDPQRAEVIAFYNSADDLERKRPFAVALFKRDSGTLVRVVIDTNQDGYVDRVLTSEEGAKSGPCEVRGQVPVRAYT